MTDDCHGVTSIKVDVIGKFLSEFTSLIDIQFVACCFLLTLAYQGL